MSYIRFESEKERLDHPIARLVPSILWNDQKYGFSKRLDRRLIPLFHCQEPKELFDRIKDINREPIKPAEIYLYSLFRFRTASVETLLRLQKELVLNNETTLILSGVFKRFDHIVKIIEYCKSDRSKNALIKNSFKIACEYGYLSLAKWLYKRIFSLEVRRNLINANNYSLLRDAIVNGKYAIAEWLYGVSHIISKRKMFEVCSDQPFKEACENGHHSTAYWLYYLGDTYTRKYMLRVAISALETAVINSHTEVVQWIFSLSVEAFKKEESKVDNYSQCSAAQVKIFVDNWLCVNKHNNSLDPHDSSGLIYISDSDATYGYYVLRYLIRENNEIMLDDIKLLLKTFHVRAVIQKFCEKNSNELLELAEDKNNLPAINLLLKIPEVKRLADKREADKREADKREADKREADKREVDKKIEELLLEKMSKKRKRVEESTPMPMLEFRDNESIPWQLEIFKPDSKQPAHKKACAYEIQESKPQSGLYYNSEDWWPTSRLV